MVHELRQVTLRNGEAMSVKLVIPPASDYADKLVHFLEHKGDGALRSIRQRLRGDYAGICVDKYFVGEIAGRIAGQLWYGYARSGTGIANFGHVYTEPEHRKKGITHELMAAFREDLDASPVRAVLCGTGRPWVAAIYAKYGFRPVLEGAPAGALALLTKTAPASFAAFEEEYFRAGQAVSVVPGTMAHRHDVDKLLKDAFLIRGEPRQRLAMASHVDSFRTACFMVEDDRGLTTVAKTANGAVVGWSFLLNTGSRAERNAPTFDFEIHPNHAGAAPLLIRESLNLAAAQGVTRAYSYCAACASARLDLLTAAGFEETARLTDYVTTADRTCDLTILVSDPRRRTARPSPG